MKSEKVTPPNTVRGFCCHRVAVISFAIALIVIISALVVIPLNADQDSEADTWDGSKDSSWHTDTTLNAYTINSAAQFASLADLCKEGNTFAGVTITLSVDVNLGNGAWVPIGENSEKPFAGIFDGNSHTITFTSSTTIMMVADADSLGVFGYVTGTVENVTVSGQLTPTVVSGASLGGLVGTCAAGTVKNCSSSLTTTVTNATDGVSVNIGGIIGHLKDGTVSGCSNNGSVSVNVGGTNITGGIVGIEDGSSTIEACNNNGTIDVISTGYSAFGGGIAGEVDQITAAHLINNQSVTVQVNTSGTNTESHLANAGGLFGIVKNNAAVTFSSNIGEVAAKASIVNSATDTNTVAAYAGGIAGKAGNVDAGLTLTNVSNAGMITVNSSGNSGGSCAVGGICGTSNHGVYRQCCNTGIVSALISGNEPLYEGGLIGDSGDSADDVILDSYNKGSISFNSGADSYVGGFFGAAIASCARNSYNLGAFSRTSVLAGSSLIEVGGLIGYCSPSGDIPIINCYNGGTITGISESTSESYCVGGIVAYCNSDSTVAKKSYWLAGVGGTGCSQDVIDKSTCFSFSDSKATIGGTDGNQTLLGYLEEDYSKTYSIDNTNYKTNLSWSYGNTSETMGTEVVFDLSYKVVLVADGGSSASVDSSINLDDKTVTILTDWSSEVDVPGLTKTG